MSSVIPFNAWQQLGQDRSRVGLGLQKSDENDEVSAVKKKALT